MTIDELAHAGRRVAKHLADEYPELVIHFSTDTSPDGEDIAVVIIRSKVHSGEVIRSINVPYLLELPPFLVEKALYAEIQALVLEILRSET